MKARPRQRRAAGGFTLLEVLVVVVLLGAAAVGVGSMQSNLFRSEAALADAQARAQLVAECGEQVWGVRRRSANGYAEVTDSTLANFGTQKCGNLPAFASYAIPTVSISAYPGSACPVGTTCSQLQITQGGLTPVTLLLIDY
jgi:prepilin-type N-terminal cleavage/methylation domain-containing protein